MLTYIAIYKQPHDPTNFYHCLSTTFDSDVQDNTLQTPYHLHHIQYRDCQFQTF